MIYIYLHVCIYTYMYVYIHMYIYIFVHMYRATTRVCMIHREFVRCPLIGITSPQGAFIKFPQSPSEIHSSGGNDAASTQALHSNVDFHTDREDFLSVDSFKNAT